MTTLSLLLIPLRGGPRGFFPYPWIGLLILLLLLLALWLIGRNRGWFSGNRRAADSAMITLQERFARGEIDADEYLARASVLRPTKAKPAPATTQPTPPQPEPAQATAPTEKLTEN